jgi:hypothetical protein
VQASDEQEKKQPFRLDSKLAQIAKSLHDLRNVEKKGNSESQGSLEDGELCLFEPKISGRFERRMHLRHLQVEFSRFLASQTLVSPEEGTAGE